MIRVLFAAKNWNDDRCYGKMCKIFFQLLHSDAFVKHWYCDVEGHKLCTLRYSIMDSFLIMGLQEAELFIPRHDLCNFLSEDTSRLADGRIHDLFINQRYAECQGIDTMVNGSISPDLSDLWHHGYLVSPQWEGGLELDFASDCNNANVEVGTSAAQDHATESGPKDYISVVRESSRSPHTSYLDEVRSPHNSIWDFPEAIEGDPFVPYERHVALLSLSAIEEILHWASGA